MIKLYKDQELKELTDSVTFGIVRAGETKQVTTYLQNGYKGEIRDIKVVVERSDVKILQQPKVLAKDAVGIVILEWSPKFDLEAGLNAKIGIKFDLLLS